MAAFEVIQIFSTLWLFFSVTDLVSAGNVYGFCFQMKTGNIKKVLSAKPL